MKEAHQASTPVLDATSSPHPTETSDSSPQRVGRLSGAYGFGFGMPDRLGMWSMWVGFACFGFGFFGGGFVPPPAPADAATTAAFYHEHVELRRVAVIMLIVGGTMFIPFGAALADRLRRIPGIGATAVYTELAAATASGTLMMVFGPFLLTALLRPDMPASSYELLNHVTWMAWIGLWQPGALEAGATAAAILSDRSTPPVFPRWVGWFSAWMAFGSLVGSLIPFFTEGPFAWNGFMAFYIAAVVFFSWFTVILVQLHKMAARDRAAQAAHPPAPPDASLSNAQNQQVLR